MLPSISEQELLNELSPAMVAHIHRGEEKGYTLEQIGEQLVSEISGHLGGSDTEPGLWASIKEELRLLICTNHPKYKDTRARMTHEGQMTAIVLLTMTTSAIGKGLGLEASLLGFITTPVVLMLMSMGRMTKEVWCAQNSRITTTEEEIASMEQRSPEQADWQYVTQTIPSEQLGRIEVRTPDMNPKADVLIVTVIREESQAVMKAFQEATGSASKPVHIGERVYHDLGEVNGASVFMALSEMGAGGLGASQQTVQKGIAALHPSAVIMVGIAFGVNEQKQTIGDVLVSQQLWLYDLQRISKDQIIPRGDKPHASPRLISCFRSADLYWEETKVRFGLILTGEKLVDSVDYRDQLKQFEPESHWRRNGRRGVVRGLSGCPCGLDSGQSNL